MERPSDISRPFFAYGLFRPGQLGFFQLRDLVHEVSAPKRVPGSLLLRDGLPIIDPTEPGYVEGALLVFQPTREGEAYDRIAAMEPDKHYRWHEIQADGTLYNVLVGRYPKKGSVRCEEEQWNGWNDPLFTEALVVVKETLESSPQHSSLDLKPLFRLQMAYLLLWSSIERYVSLRYHLGAKVTEKVDHLAREEAFAAGLRDRVIKQRVVFRADRPKDRVALDPAAPADSLRYYYQVRSNITHRGKGVGRDYGVVKDSLTELLPIFCDVLRAAQRDAAFSN